MEILLAIQIWLSLIGYSVNVRMRHEMVSRYRWNDHFKLTS